MGKGRYFQFLGGPRIGEVVIFDKIEEDDGIVYVTFKDNSRCTEELILPLNDQNHPGKYMAEVESPNNIWNIKTEIRGRQEEQTELNEAQERVVVTPFHPGKKHTILIPPKKTHSNFGAITNHIEAPEPITEPIAEPIVEAPKISDDPVHLMVDKSKKFDTEVSLDMTISLPKSSLYNVIDESFENGGDTMIDYIVDNMDIKIIQDALKQALLNSYRGENINEYIVKDNEWAEGGKDYPVTLSDIQVLEEPLVSEPRFASEEEIAKVIANRKKDSA
jgi:hypothetical protein